MADPGMMRSPSFKRFITCGSVLLLLLYLVFWPFWWLVLKTSKQGMQSILYGVFCGELPAPIEEAVYIQECDVRSHMARAEMNDKELQKEVFDKTKLMVEVIEKKSAIDRKKLEEKLKKEGKASNGSKTEYTPNSTASDEKITPIEEEDEESTTGSTTTTATGSATSRNDKKKRNRKRKT